MADESTNPVDDLAADIRAVDGNHDLGAAKLAQALTDLGWTKGGKAEYPYESGDVTVIGPGIFVSSDKKVLSWEGQNYIPQPAAKQLKLSEYKAGDQVEVVKNGDFMAGFVQDIDKGTGHVHVHTKRGPVTVASAHFIRKV